MEQPIEETKEIITSVYNTSIDSIQMALALSVAFAWYGFIKGGVNLFMPERSDKVLALGAYAIIMTILFVIVLYVIRKVLKVPVTQRPIGFVVAPTL